MVTVIGKLSFEKNPNMRFCLGKIIEENKEKKE
jgi:hypothetical protein